jgi:hypothetical protein
MSDFPNLEELRGATFDEVTVDWRNGIALVAFLPSATRKECRTLRATGLSNVVLSRRDGASAMVASARRADRQPDGPPGIEITLETGELLRIEAASFAVKVTAG